MEVLDVIGGDVVLEILNACHYHIGNDIYKNNARDQSDSYDPVFTPCVIDKVRCSFRRTFNLTHCDGGRNGTRNGHNDELPRTGTLDS